MGNKKVDNNKRENPEAEEEKEDTSFCENLLRPYMLMEWESLPRKMGKIVDDSEEYLEDLPFKLENRDNFEETVREVVVSLHKDYFRVPTEILWDRLENLDNWEKKKIKKCYQGGLVEVGSIKPDFKNQYRETIKKLKSL